MADSVIQFTKPSISDADKQLVLEALDGSLSSDGRFADQCVARISEILDTPYVLLTPSCTQAIELALLVLGLKPGDEVLLPSFTFVSTANAVILHGGTPVFVEIEEATRNLDPNDLKNKITPATVGIIPVHYGGNACDMDTICQIASEAGLWVVEDAAHAFGARYKGKALGTFGEFGCFSFHSTKNLVCGEGGALVMNRGDLFHEAEIFREKGTNRAAFLRNDIDKYTWLRKGSSFLLAEPLAALLCGQLKRWQEITMERKRIWQLYREGLEPLAQAGLVHLQRISEQNESSWHIFSFLVADEATRQALLMHLKRHHIMASSHFVPLHASPFAREHLGTAPGNLPVTEQVAARLVRLPLYCGLSPADTTRIMAAVKGFFSSFGATSLAQR